MALADELREEVLSRSAVGELLGSESDLVRRHGVSPPTLRQAMRVLQAEGLVSVRRGVNGGFFAAAPSAAAVARAASTLLRHQGATLDDIRAVVRFVAPEVAALAAANPDAGQRSRLFAFVEDAWAGRPDLTDGEVLGVAVEFGRALGRLSGNPALALVADVLSTLVAGGAGSFDPSRPPLGPDRALAIREAHLAIATAVLERDSERAARTMLQLCELSHDWGPAETDDTPATRSSGRTGTP
ncbi:FadR/GntR family transcriptional regulator [Cryptosporangium aurantiacum]|nr:FCD domain-containing protein [Cryptosporangium aurantiacum]